MTLEQSTNAVLLAVEAEDLGALSYAIEAREIALRATPHPSREALEAGERACGALIHLKQRWAAEAGRLDQVRTGFDELAASEGGMVLHG